MKHLPVLFVALLFSLPCPAQKALKRPRILGISQVDMYSSNPVATRSFYRKVLDAGGPCHWCEEVPRSPMIVPINDVQFVMLWSSPKPLSNFLAQISFLTNDLNGMKKFLTAKGITYSEAPFGAAITLRDPEGHAIGFTQHEHPRPWSPEASSIPHIIHAGFVVRDRAATDHFYKDILGFRPYWHGGMKDDKDDWAAMQVPDGTDWVEYMLNIPLDADKKLLGVMNHIALGVTDIQATKAQLLKNGWEPGEQPKIGRDGKWQLNLYDPDDTRIEFMEFTPKEKPCCSEFTGPHPGPKQ
jgi:catechol 2,3-dioxygenase-like lactoylglutathione lyase family enzyme